MALKEELEKQGNFLFRHRSNLPLLILLFALAVYCYTVAYSSKGSIVDAGWYHIACLMVSLSGLAVRIATVGYTPKGTSGRNTEEQVADELNQTGMYSIVRHPLYLGNFLMWLGPAMLSANLWFIVLFICIYWLYYERIMFAEEQYLYRKFGKEYLAWTAKTPAFMPSLLQWKRAGLSFSWRKVLRSEKNGLAATFIIFYLFEALRELIEYHDAIIQDNPWLYAALLSVIIYLILKLLKRKTSYLNEEGR